MGYAQFIALALLRQGRIYAVTTAGGKEKMTKLEKWLVKLENKEPSVASWRVMPITVGELDKLIAIIRRQHEALCNTKRMGSGFTVNTQEGLEAIEALNDVERIVASQKEGE